MMMIVRRMTLCCLCNSYKRRVARVPVARHNKSNYRLTSLGEVTCRSSFAMEVSLQLKRWFEASLQSLIDGIESVDKILPFLRGKDVISDSDCKEILAERGEKQRVELCLLKVIKNDQTSLYRNVWAALSLPYPRLYADVCIRLHERFGPAVLEG